MERPRRLRVAIAAPLSAELVERLQQREPRLDLLVDHSLLPPMRFPADFAGDPAFTRSPAEQTRFETMLDSADAHYGIADTSPSALKRAVAANPRLRWVHTMAAGGGSQVAAAGLDDGELSRVVFTTSAGVHARPLAEFALFGLLAGTKDLPGLQRDQAAREWPAVRRPLGVLAGSTVLVAGLGGIGREVVSLLGGLGVTVLGLGHRTSHPVPGLARRIRRRELADTIGEVDGIVLALPGTARTEGLFGADLLRRVKPGTVLVNVGRGTVIDEPALIEALRIGRLGYAALDVVAQEPLSRESELWSLPNVLISPHTAALDPREEERIADLFAANATLFLDGRTMTNVVDTVEFY
ncbi:D-2-hydroxyacid dehydrogenase [Agromyces albus]|uniref:D-2-hydroxyacid dehydrogenase n=1 Tax=Agromyces albus TaxID=205332 RepID=A0A4Q2KRD7_9MICO|nr:D-2-hydroxyacid dehydrogenase [Agromyces albus]RXZ67147.1 D-2-hydroxyacid dehydrogenase [Agromyces albus]